MKTRLFLFVLFLTACIGTSGFAQSAKSNSSSMFGSPSAGSGGSVTSVDLSLPAIFTVTGGPVTSTGTLTGTLATQAANTHFAGPTTGAAATPTFRALVDADLSGTNATLGGNSFSGTGLIIRQTSPTLTTPTLNTPTIAVFTNATHTHADAAGGGQLGITAHTSGSLSGNGSKLATVTGTLTSGNCVKIDASGNLVDHGSACGSGGGGGSPGGSNGNIQYNNSGALGGVPILNYSAGNFVVTGRTDMSTSSDSVRVLAVSAPSTSSFGVIEAQTSGTTFGGFWPNRTLYLSIISDPSSPQNGSYWTSGDTNSFSYQTGSLKHVVTGTIFTATASRTLTNSTSETSLLPSGVGTKTISASYFLAGKTVCYEALGYWSTDAVPGTFQVKVKLGSTTIYSTAANTPTGGLSNRGLSISGCLTARTTGGSGTVIGQGNFTSATSASAGAMWEMVATSTSTIDTTTSQVFDITGTASVGSTSNSLTITNFRLWVHN